MNVLIVGSGGREHALAWKLSRSKRLTRLFCAPGNPGIATLAECVPLPAGDVRALLDWAVDRRIDLTVVGPEQPLASGIADLFADKDLAIFGPSRAAARLEWSKAFAKAFMQRHGIPTARFLAFTRAEHAAARAYVATFPGKVVLKADGLAAGKGVVVCDDAAAATATLDAMMSGRAFGSAADTMVIEEFLDGTEASVFAVCDGVDAVILAPACDHKRALDGNTGKNTGGMGAFAPAPTVTAALLDAVTGRILTPTLRGMAAEGAPFKGCLYLGLMLTADGPQVVEYNCRFGDPETQVVLPLYDGDLLELLHSAATGALGRTAAGAIQRSNSGAATCVVMASEGYPDAYATGREITGVGEAASLPGVMVFHAGTEMQDGKLVTAGGRVLGVTAVAADGDLRRATALAYEAAGRITFQGMHYRHDIAGAIVRSPITSRENS
jgi:phosphoribosylamine---glycine ligase